MLLKESEIIIQSISKEIEIITKRISAINNVYYKTSNLALKKRLIKEYINLKSKFEEINYKITLFKIKNKENISYSSILMENYYRCEKLIDKNNNLFFV